MNFNEKIALGRTGLKAGQLGIASSFGAPAEAYEEAFDRGCNYFTLGTFIKGRSSHMKTAISNICKKGHRENLIVVMITYAHNARLTNHFLYRDMRNLGIDYTDILLLGYFNKRPNQRIIDGAMQLKENGLVRYIGLTSHKRTLFPKLTEEGLFDIFHIRYNAAHRGAETEIFPHITGENRPGMITFTATRWKRLLNPKKMPTDTPPPPASDCYRFVLSHPSVDVCMMGARNMEQMRENLTVLDQGPMSESELQHMRKIGDHIYGKKIIF